MAQRRLSTFIAASTVALVSCSAADETMRSPVVSSSPGAQPGRLVEIDTMTGSISRDLEVGRDPLLAVAAEGSVWTLNLGDGSLSRIDTTTGAVEPIRTGTAVGIASDGADIWVTADERLLVQVDGVTGAVERSVTLADQPLFQLRDAGFLAIAGGDVWITIPAGEGARQVLWRVDPASGQVVSKIRIVPDPMPIVAAYGAVWIADGRETVLRVDVRTEVVTTIETASFNGTFAAGGDRFWASTAGELHELEPATGRELRVLDVTGAARGIAWVDGSVWVATPIEVIAVDPDTGMVEQRVQLAEPSPDEGPIALVPVDRSLWVAIETE